MSVSDFATPKPASISIFSLSKTSKEEEGIEPLGLIAGPPFVPKRKSSFLIAFCKLICTFK